MFLFQYFHYCLNLVTVPFFAKFEICKINILDFYG